MTFGERLASARQDRGWTQADLAARLGVAESQILHWELYSLPDLMEFRSLVLALGCSADWLLGVEGGK